MLASLYTELLAQRICNQRNRSVPAGREMKGPPTLKLWRLYNGWGRKTGDWGKGIETSGKYQKRMSESALTRITTRFGTRFARRFARLNPESVYWRYFLAQRAKATPTSFGNLVANLVPNLIDCNTLNTNIFYSKTWFLDVFSGTLRRGCLVCQRRSIAW